MATARKARRSFPTPVDRLYLRDKPDDSAALPFWDRYFAGDDSAELHLIEHYAPIVHKRAARCKNRNPQFYVDSLDELMSDGMLCLIHSIRGAKPSVCPYFSGAINRRLSAMMSRGQRQRSGFPPVGKTWAVRDAQAAFIHEHGRVPTKQEMADALGVPINNPNIQLGDRPSTSRFSELSDDDGRSPQFTDTKTQSSEKQLLDRETIELMLRESQGRDLEILTLLLKGIGPTQIAKQMNLSRQRIHQRLNGLLWQARARAGLAECARNEARSKPKQVQHRLPAILTLPPARKIA